MTDTFIDPNGIDAKKRQRMLSGVVMTGIDPNDLAQAGWGVLVIEQCCRLTPIP